MVTSKFNLLAITINFLVVSMFEKVYIPKKNTKSRARSFKVTMAIVVKKKYLNKSWKKHFGIVNFVVGVLSPPQKFAPP